MAAQAIDLVVVITGGDPVERAHLPELPPGTVVIAADSGVEHAQALGLTIDLAVGDFDSVTPEALAVTEKAGARIERHPAAKDATDLELALDAALALAPSRIQVLGGHGGRLDHLLANALLLAGDRCAGVAISARMGAATVSVIRDEAALHGPHGDLVTLLPVGGPARGVRTAGLLYPLQGEDLHPGSTRGVSNEPLDDPATVALDAGVLLAIQPGQLGSHSSRPTSPQEAPR